MDMRPVDYEKDDGGDQNDPRIAPYCAPGIYDISSEEFTENNL